MCGLIFCASSIAISRIALGMHFLSDVIVVETEIATLIVRGYGKREIAGVLAMKKREVKLHAREIFHKLGVEGWRELAGPASDRSL